MPARAISPRTGRWIGLALALIILAPALLVAACSWKALGPASANAIAPDHPFYDPARHIGEPTIRVRIARARPAVTIDAPSGDVQVKLTPGFAPHLTSHMTPPIQVTASHTAWRIIDGLGATRTIPRVRAGAAEPTEDTLTIHPPLHAALDFDNAKHSGDLVLHAVNPDDQTSSPGAAIDVVEHVPIELYLSGVISKELYASWRLETYKAQAIAARSYALHERQRRATQGGYVDVENSTANQVYAGRTANRTAIKAIEQTRGVVLTWRGDVLRAYYCSTVGGRAASAADTWPTGPGSTFNLAAPLQASARTDVDSFSPRYRWTVERRRDALSARLRAWAQRHGSALRNIRKVKRIEVHATNAFMRPTRYRLYDDDGSWYELSAEALRVACNTPAPDLPFPAGKKRISSSDFEVTTRGDTLVFKGRGFGHGVGMSQFGAEGMARAGVTADEILAHYYPGATLERAYSRSTR